MGPSKVGDIITLPGSWSIFGRIPVGVASRTRLANLSLGLVVTWPNYPNHDLFKEEKCLFINYLRFAAAHFVVHCTKIQSLPIVGYLI